MGQPVHIRFKSLRSLGRPFLCFALLLMGLLYAGTLLAQEGMGSSTRRDPEGVGSLHSGPPPVAATATPATPATKEPTTIAKDPPVAEPEEISEISMMDNIISRARESYVFASVLLVLLFLSAMSWFIIFYKWMYFHKLKSASKVFSAAFWKTEKLDALYGEASQFEACPCSEMFRGGYEEIARIQKDENHEDKQNGISRIERTLRRIRMNQNAEMESSLTFLATTGSAAPFIGLFGTVWGIMEAFAHIDPNQNLLTSVAPYIAEALVATAIGLLAAIPAVMAYNFFVRAVRHQIVEMDNFSAEFLNLVQRHFFR